MRQPVPVSVCIVTNQWHPKLEVIFNVLKDKVSEILLGVDGTMEMVPSHLRQSFVTVIPVKWEGYSNTKNNLAAKAQNDWILSLDSDEVPDETLISAIYTLDYAVIPVNRQYEMKRVSFFEGKMIHHGSWGNDRVIRLYNRTVSKWDNAIVHESLDRNQNTEIIRLKGILLHYTADDFQTFMEKSMRYARLSADKYYQNKKKAGFVKSYLSPAFSFLKEYLFQAGFLDGSGGWKIAAGNAKYTYWKYQFLKEKYKTVSSK
jgi:(heptosyl)LPS beta-1,4-glucosyltransferase